ncbi:hypothetical protein TNCV_3535181 [Trichonephila clavipes]|nr:hypothetical protein TNCV_3535181 [Trichonephila clavipes]
MVIKEATPQGSYAVTIQHKTWKLQPVCYRTLHDSECLNCRDLCSKVAKAAHDICVVYGAITERNTQSLSNVLHGVSANTNAEWSKFMTVT